MDVRSSRKVAWLPGPAHIVSDESGAILDFIGRRSGLKEGEPLSM